MVVILLRHTIFTTVCIQFRPVADTLYLLEMVWFNQLDPYQGVPCLQGNTIVCTRADLWVTIIALVSVLANK